jgi:hypothetical protein
MHESFDPLSHGSEFHPLIIMVHCLKSCPATSFLFSLIESATCETDFKTFMTVSHCEDLQNQNIKSFSSNHGDICIISRCHCTKSTSHGSNVFECSLSLSEFLLTHCKISLVGSTYRDSGYCLEMSNSYL